MAQIVITRDKRPVLDDKFADLNAALYKLLDRHEGDSYTETEFASFIFQLIYLAESEVYDRKPVSSTVEEMHEYYVHMTEFIEEVVRKLVGAYAENPDLLKRILLKMNRDGSIQ